MKWTKRQPKVSGYYWVKAPARYADGKLAGGYYTPAIVRVTIDNDPEWPRHVFCYPGNDIEFDITGEEIWSGLIPLPKEPTSKPCTTFDKPFDMRKLDFKD